MSSFKVFSDSLRRAYIKSLYKLKSGRQSSDSIHLDEAMNWLVRAQDSTNDDGVSAYYDLLERKWALSYPETTGYIIPTFLTYSLFKNKSEFFDRAVKMGKWQIKIQLPSGGCRAGNVSNNFPRVFNTGQIILGWCSLYKETHDNNFLDAAVKAADWLTKVQNKNGTWSKYTYKGPKTYHSRVSWALLEVWKLSGKKKYYSSANRNLNWVLEQQNEWGWFRNTSLSEPGKPWTHLIAYTIRGVLESSQLESDSNARKTLLKSALKASEALMNYSLDDNSLLPASFNKKWSSQDSYSCLTGDAQIAVIWLKFAKITKNRNFRIKAQKQIYNLINTQVIKAGNKNLAGGILGSAPIDGKYCKFKVLCWATKFLADALIMQADNNIDIRS